MLPTDTARAASFPQIAVKRSARAAVFCGLLTLVLAFNSAAQETPGVQMKLDTKDNGGNEVGRVIVLNADDDNRDGIPDMDESPVIGETSLRKLTITWLAPELLCRLPRRSKSLSKG